MSTNNQDNNTGTQQQQGGAVPGQQGDHVTKQPTSPTPGQQHQAAPKNDDMTKKDDMGKSASEKR